MTPQEYKPSSFFGHVKCSAVKFGRHRFAFSCLPQCAISNCAQARCSARAVADRAAELAKQDGVRMRVHSDATRLQNHGGNSSKLGASGTVNLQRVIVYWQRKIQALYNRVNKLLHRTLLSPRITCTGSNRIHHATHRAVISTNAVWDEPGRTLQQLRKIFRFALSSTGA